jgi:hypothetical protein
MVDQNNNELENLQETVATATQGDGALVAIFVCIVHYILE